MGSSLKNKRRDPQPDLPNDRHGREQRVKPAVDDFFYLQMVGLEASGLEQDVVKSIALSRVEAVRLVEQAAAKDPKLKPNDKKNGHHDPPIEQKCREPRQDGDEQVDPKN